VIANIFGPDLGYVVMIVLIVLVGGSQLPKIARNIGTAGKEFRKAQQEAEEEAQRENAAQAQPAVAPAPVPPAVFAAPAVSATASPEAREEQVRREAAG
jgi:sec-independent protein translocase protein TatA